MRVAPALLALLALPPGSGQLPESPRPTLEFLGERALENDTFLPTSAATEAQLARGDQAWQAALEGRDASARRAEAFDAWHAALELAAPGEAVRAAENPHAVQGVEAAVRARLQQAGAPAWAAWRERFGPLAELELAAAASDPAAWERIEQRQPFTRGAARAALKLADLARESDQPQRARAWLERCRRALDASADADLLAALARRELAATTPAATASSIWERARGLELVTSFELGPADSLRPLERTRVYSGACAPGPGELCVQTARELLCFSGTTLRARHDLDQLLRRRGLAPPATFADRSSDWPLAPATCAGGIVCVLGRSSERVDNVLVCLRAETGELSWAWSATGRTPPAASDEESGWFEHARIEFEPGPCCALEQVVVQVRAWPELAGAEARAEISAGRIESWLCAFAAVDGRLLWRRQLARGATPEAALDQPNLGRHVLPSPAAPLSLSEAGVLASTGLGTLSCVDPLDGQLSWTWRAARARREEPSNPRLAGALERDARIVWRPEDGPYLYELDGARGLPRAATTALPPGRAWLGGASEGLVCTAERGAGWEQLSRLRPLARTLDPGVRDRALPLGRVWEARALVVSESGLWLLDRSRELAVLERRELGPGGGGRPVLDGEQVWVLGEARISLVRAR